MKDHYQSYLPEKAILQVQQLVEQHHFVLKIVNQRQTKHGDFRKLPNGDFQITINNNLNKYQFLLTLIHEVAHHITFQKYGRAKPHGNEWKMTFQQLMLPYLHPDIYPNHILPLLANYLKNPKASTDADVKLSLAIKEYSREVGKSYIFELPLHGLFRFKNVLYKKGTKRRTRIECLNTENNRVYLFNQNVAVYEE